MDMVCRVLFRRCAAKTPEPHEHFFRLCLRLKEANESFEQPVLNYEELFRRYEGIAERPIPECIRCALLVACCTKDLTYLQYYLDMSPEDLVYGHIRKKTSSWIERKRAMQPKP